MTVSWKAPVKFVALYNESQFGRREEIGVPRENRQSQVDRLKLSTTFAEEMEGLLIFTTPAWLPDEYSTGK